jgi:tRNA (adenine37-N6)-methyltransferase
MPSRQHESRARPAPRAQPDAPLTLHPIGVVRSPFVVHEGTPRQASVAPLAEAEIVLRPGMQNLLKDLSGFSHVWVLFWFNYSRGWNAQVRPPRDSRKRGLFATRAPHRPNPIGLSAVELVSIRGCTLKIRGVDILNGSPVLDIKPYVPYADAFPEARAGWIDELPEDPGPDHRAWVRKA